MRVALIVVAMASLTGCANLFAGRVDASNVAFDASRREEVWGKAVDELARRGFALEQEDRARGVIRTSKSVRPGRVPCGFVTCRYRDQVEITMLADGAARVRLSRELESPMVTPYFVSTDWVKPSRWQKSTLEGIAQEQRELLEAITGLARAKRGLTQERPGPDRTSESGHVGERVRLDGTEKPPDTVPGRSNGAVTSPIQP
jgi:hypothetical protein